jgi:hypothetical protein
LAKVLKGFYLEPKLVEQLEERAHETKRSHSDVASDALNFYFYGTPDAGEAPIEELRAKKEAAEAELARKRAETKAQEDLALKLSAAIAQREAGKLLTREMFSTVIESELRKSISLLSKYAGDPVMFQEQLGIQFELVRKTGWEGTKTDLMKMAFDEHLKSAKDRMFG